MACLIHCWIYSIRPGDLGILELFNSSINSFPPVYFYFGGFPGGSDGKESACHVGGLGSIPGLGRSPGGE